MHPRTLIATTGHGISRAVENDSGEWQVDVLLQDQAVYCLAADPLNRQVVYAATNGSGVLRSEDCGETWRPAGLTKYPVKALAVSRAEPGVIYAGTKPPHLFVSRDAGGMWAELESFLHIPGRWFWFSPAELPFTAMVHGIALSPTNANVMVVGVEAGAVVRSGDGGQTWTRHLTGALRDCHTLIFHATSGDWTYEAGGTGGGAAFSQSAGESWTQPGEGLDRHYGWSCAADPAHPDIWYLSASPMPKGFGPPPAHVDGRANAAIYRMKAGRWQLLAGGLPQPLNFMAYALVTDPQASGHIYAGLSNGDVWHSADYGDSWKQLPVNLGSVHRNMILV
jgi:hypothetical protein